MDILRRRHLIAAAAPFLVGTALRLWNLRDQILGGDETHALRAAVNLPLSKILVTYQQTDNCIPLTAFYKLLMLGGMRVGEMLFRLPVLLCGLAALLALPAAFEGRVGKETVLVYRWLVAVSPLLILYSRIARSYMPMVLLSFGAVMAFEAWWRSRSWRSGAAYVALGALAVWFHLGAGPIVAAPFAFAGIDALVRRERLGRDLRDLALLGLALAGAFALFLVPALGSLREVVAGKHVEQAAPWGAVWGVLKLQAGTGDGVLAVMLWVAALAGLGLMLRTDRRLALYTVTVVAGQVVGLLILSPLGLENPVIFSRYLLPVLPFVLLWMASSSGWSKRGIGWRAGVFVAVVFLMGPFADRATWRTSFLHHNDFVAFYKPRPTLPADAVPDFYRRLHGETVVEFPWLFMWEANRSFYLYQEIHGGRVVVASPQGILYRSPLALRNAVAPEPGAICRSGARYLIVHRNVAREEEGIAPGGRLVEGEAAQPLRRLARSSAAELGRRLEGEWGAPVFEDGVVRVWDLGRVCGGERIDTDSTD
ncbi:MAG TPA: hypothetical protein VFR03_08340 [Thermoanaerobaculia bacterium]|nr:hypothetical protein [Thermoanaerobaculia bacterium]